MSTVWSVSVILLGFLSAGILFWRRPRLPAAKANSADPDAYAVTVIIPARNEEASLPLLLSDLKLQTVLPHEVIVANDASEDRTAEIAASFGAKVLTLRNKPAGWMGKSWACQQAADAVRTDLLLFLDADVRMGPDAVARLLQAYFESGTTVSVQPWHRTEKAYEQLSFLVSLMSMAANGAMMPKPRTAGLYGPVILMPRQDYQAIGGHEAVRQSIVDDISLGRNLRRANLGYSLFIGDPNLSYRMYPGGLKSLLEGWTKNLAAGASRAPLSVVLFVFLWMTSVTAVPLNLIEAARSRNTLDLLLYSLLYLAWVVVFSLLAKVGGRYQSWAWLVYPVPLLTLLYIFAVSLIRRIFRLNVRWKGRSISTRRGL